MELQRLKYHNTEHKCFNNLKDLFKDVSVENILSFLKNVNLLNKI